MQDREFERATEFMAQVLTEADGLSEYELARAVIEGLLALYAKSPALHRLLAIEGLRVTPTERVLAFDTRVVALIRSFLATGHLTIRRQNLDAAAFVIYQAVRATMLARLLEEPPGLDDEALIEEMTDLVVRYLVQDPAVTRTRTRVRAAR